MEALLEELDTPLASFTQLLDYYKFKKKTQDFSSRQDSSVDVFPRGICGSPVDWQRSDYSGIEELSLHELSSVLYDLLSRLPDKSKLGADPEEWRVVDQILKIRSLVFDCEEISFTSLFSRVSCKEELIVSFLAMLELMKIGELTVRQEGITAEEIFLRRRFKDEDRVEPVEAGISREE